MCKRSGVPCGPYPVRRPTGRFSLNWRSGSVGHGLTITRGRYYKKSQTTTRSMPVSPGRTWACKGRAYRSRRWLMLEFLNNEIVADVVKSAVVIFALLTAFAYMTLIERRVVAKIQVRLGPNAARPFAAFDPLV